MPSIRQELAKTRSARWYQVTRSAQQRTAWAERVRCYTALTAVLADHAAGAAEGDAPARGPGPGRHGQPPIELSGLITLVARRAHFAGAEPVYRRFRHQHEGRPVARWAGPEPAIKPAAALVAEAKITAFWPYREGVIKVADAFDMTPNEWAAAYLRAVAAWAGEERLLAACRPAGPPECVREDMTVLAAITAAPDAVATGGAPAEPAELRGTRLHELAGDVVRAVLSDGSITALGAFNVVRAEVRQLFTVPAASLADQLARAIAELSDRIMHGSDEDVPTPGQAARLRTMAGELTALLGSLSAPDGIGRDQPEEGEP